MFQRETGRVYLPIVNNSSRLEREGNVNWEGKGSGTITITTPPQSSCPTINNVTRQSDDQYKKTTGTM